MKAFKYLALGLFIFASMATVSSCRKKEDTIAKIIVRDGNNALVAGATVRLYGKGTDPENCPECTGSTINFDRTATTNSSGEAIFDLNETYQLGQAGVGVFDIKATKGSDSGTGVIKVEQETTTVETVFI